ncbi:MAG: glycogen debranching enzyme [Cellvibrionaceae bacterium]|jgi:glycogen debranching enzyme
MMRDQLRFCALHQGQQNDPKTGEEPGKIHHELPGYPIRDLLTTYNACDAAAFYLIGHGWLQTHFSNPDFLNKYRDSIKMAAGYIENHLNKSRLFEENPAYCGAKHFALNVTYWKDSVILDRAGGEPVYPAVYTLAHLQNLCGMRHAATLLESEHCKALSIQMQNAIPELFDGETGTFFTAIDGNGPIRAISSDALHGLFYLEPGDLPQAQVESIVLASEMLESQIGYMLMTPEDGYRMERAYHADTVWPFEQALIHAGAKKFGLERVMRICQRVTRALNGRTSPELLAVKVIEPEISSNPQLWTIAAKGYFSKK